MKKDTNSIFAKNLNRLMAEKKITVEKASQVANVSKSNIVSWRSGVAPTNFEAVKKLAELFGVSFSFLLTGVEESSSDKKIATVTEVFKEGDLLFDGFAKITIQRLIPREDEE